MRLTRCSDPGIVLQYLEHGEDGHYAKTEINSHDFGSTTLLHALFAITIVSVLVLGCFIVENLLHMFSVGIVHFITDPLMILDIIVVSLAFGFEIHELELLHAGEDGGGGAPVGVNKPIHNALRL